MAATRLTIFNDALLLLGQRPLADLNESHEFLEHLNTTYDNRAVDYCLERVCPRFASRLVTIEPSGTTTEHGFSNVFQLPNDYLKLLSVYRTDQLDEMVNRYLIQQRTILSPHNKLFLRYIASDDDIDNWTPSFVEVVSAFIAKECALRIQPDLLQSLSALFEQRTERAKAQELSDKEPTAFSQNTNATLTDSERTLYNDALHIMGLPHLTSNDDDSEQRVAMDEAMNMGLVETMFESTGWQFALVTKRLVANNRDNSRETQFGYAYRYEKPENLLRVWGIYHNENLTAPLKYYHDEQGRIFADIEELYLQYVSKDLISSIDSWTPAFRRAVAGRLAYDTVTRLRPDYFQLVTVEYSLRLSKAESIDAMNSPPHIFHNTTWIRSRYNGSSYGSSGSSNGSRF